MSAFQEGHYISEIVAKQDVKFLVCQICTHLLAAGVLKPVDLAKSSPDTIFRVCNECNMID